MAERLRCGSARTPVKDLVRPARVGLIAVVAAGFLRHLDAAERHERAQRSGLSVCKPTICSSRLVRLADGSPPSAWLFTIPSNGPDVFQLRASPYPARHPSRAHTPLCGIYSEGCPRVYPSVPPSLGPAEPKTASPIFGGLVVLLNKVANVDLFAPDDLFKKTGRQVFLFRFLPFFFSHCSKCRQRPMQ